MATLRKVIAIVLHSAAALLAADAGTRRTSRLEISDENGKAARIAMNSRNEIPVSATAH